MFVNNVNTLSFLCGELVGSIIEDRYLLTSSHDSFRTKNTINYSQEDIQKEEEAYNTYRTTMGNEAKKLGYKELLYISSHSKEYQKILTAKTVKDAWKDSLKVRYELIRKYFPHTIDCKIPVTLYEEYLQSLNLGEFQKGIDSYLWNTDVSLYGVKEVKLCGEHCWFFEVILELDKHYFE